MKVIHTFTEEVDVCDVCQQEQDLAKRWYVRKCDVCGKDACSKHAVELTNPHKWICVAHFDQQTQDALIARRVG